MGLSIKRVSDYIHWHLTHWVRLAPEHRAPLFELLALLAPMQAVGVSKVRLGGGRDGGYVMLDDFTGIDLAFSLGIGPDVSWDYDIAEKGIPVRQFDHTVSAPPRVHPLFQFEQKRVIAQRPGIDGITLDSLLRDVSSKQSLLKIDIEGDEWDVLASLDPHLLGNCRQIVIELHDFLSIKNPEWTRKARQALSILAVNFGVVHVHGNNLSKHILLEGDCFPDSLEVTFANRRFYKLEPTQETFPGPYDKKNNPFFPDFKLGRFTFPQTHS